MAQTDEELKAAVLVHALAHAAADGFTDAVLQRAARDAGASPEQLAHLFPQGPLSLVEAFSTRADDAMERALGDISAMKVRERIASAVLARIAAVRPHKEAARRAAAFLLLPQHAALGAKLVYQTVDRMWRAAGDTSTDFNFYTKRGILAGVYTSTLMRWFNDASDDEHDTRAFLDARIENVMQFEKFKAEMKARFASPSSSAS
ncbi:MAG: COQ9 family protein [Alphaproteobacteria bacterium]|nr:COQ9 family protein [Alphaproteobacteria bacterium]